MLQISCASLAKAAFALGLLDVVSAVSATSSTTSPKYNCNPSDSCWPSNAEWETFNSSLSGNLHRTIPFAASCYYDSTFYDPAACKVVEKNYITNQARTDIFGAATGLNWESCHAQTCALNAEDSFSVLSSTCDLGRLSSLYVDAREAQHVVTAVKFAKAHNLRISIKNTGHDYFGRSTSPNTLAIWTHNMDSLAYHADFTASKCPRANGQHIGEMGAGTQALSAYEYFTGYGMDVAGGNEGSVGLAGGFGQGGGHGVFGPAYGLMVDNAVEFEVVTADGELKTINECNDPDLFWAMRGGGGGTFAILTSYRFQLHPAVKINVYSFTAKFKLHGNATTNYRALEQVLTQHATHQPVWSNNNVSGHAYYWPDKMELYLVLPSNNVTALKSLSRGFSSFLTHHSDIEVGESNYTTYPKYTGFLSLTNSIAAEVTPGGIWEAVASRLMPRSLFETKTSVSNLVKAVIEGMMVSNKLVPDGGSLTQIIMTTPVNHQNGNATSANPVWRSALWHTLMTGGWTKKLSNSEENELQEAWLGTIEPLKALTPGGGCYVNEGSYKEPQWQDTFYGSNYHELLQIKEQYDPTHFFDCYKCVGWNGPSE
ncbi:CAZyme family AA7 [Penicillium hispanicum]|uniref:CAZyme family AA7 n=1 Tax=Penicillium hispanicum TaxID=1080232 RepID=UPI0025417726|nr:CAZyme family AA7 [Penicillium hispanicum]KAJ5587484.1 CAZyme family AA7 [Penicillium hispanicum]